MSTIKVNNLQHPSAASPAIVLDADGNATVAGMGLVLVKPTSIANSGGSASLSGGAVTFTGVTSLSLNGCFTSTYENYLVLCSFVTTTGADMFVRLRVGGTDNTTASSYLSQRLIASAVTVTGSRYSSDQWYAFQGGTQRNNYRMNLYAPQLAVTTGFESSITRTDGGAYFATYTGDHQVASSFDGFTSLFGSSTSGTIRVYGYQN